MLNIKYREYADEEFENIIGDEFTKFAEKNNVILLRKSMTCKNLTERIAIVIAADLETKRLELFDMKIEFGKSGDGIMLIDEISAGCMRVYRNGVPVAPMELGALNLGQNL